MKIENLSVAYGKNLVYDNFNFYCEDNKITCILGESGCGKTTLLNAVAQLVKYSGRIEVPKNSYVFQEHRLIPSLTVLDNLKLIGATQIEVEGALKEVGLSSKINQYPARLSGGEAQRISLCRAFLYQSQFLLMDEPFSSLDLKTKFSVMDMFKHMQTQSGRGALFVTHDVDEACYLADRIVVLKNGTVVKDIQNIPDKEFSKSLELRSSLIQVLLE